MLRNPLQAAYEQITRVQSDDPDVVRRGRLLNTLIPAVLLMGLVFTVVQAFRWGARSVPLDLALTFVGIPLCLGAMWICRRGEPGRAAYLFLGILWTSLTAALLAAATIEDAFTVVPFLFSLPVIVAGLTAGRIAPFVFAVLAIAALSIVAFFYPHAPAFVVDAAGQPQLRSPSSAVGSLIIYGGFLLVVAFLSTLFERTVATALRETGRRATDLAETRADLVRRRREQQLAGAVRSQVANLTQTVLQQNGAVAMQQASAQHVTATVAELAATARAITATARDVSAAASRVLGSVEQGEASVSATSDAVGYLSERVLAIRERVNTVNGHVQQIAEIADLLTDIGDNIHLLALNATIEAAGAGPYGTRFAVVAHEVQELADRVRIASEQVRTQVLDIQTATASALVSVEAGQAGAESAVSQAAQTREVHAQIHQTAEEASALAAQIASGTNQQQSASAQVLRTLRDISHSAQQLAEENSRVAAATTRLGGLVAELEAAQQVEADAAPATPAPALPSPT